MSLGCEECRLPEKISQGNQKLPFLQFFEKSKGLIYIGFR
jgi:hypothetical protein